MGLQQIFDLFGDFGIRIAKSVFGICLTCVLYSVQLEVTLFTYIYFLVLAGLYLTICKLVMQTCTKSRQ